MRNFVRGTAAVAALAPAVAALAAAIALPAAPAQAGADPYIGEVMLVGFSWCPRAYLPAAGQLLAIRENAALFSLLGTIYGGDGRTTFALPDLRGRAPVGAGHGAGLANIPVGAKGGAEQVTISQAEMPSHSHPATTDVTADVKLRATAQRAGGANPVGNVLGRAAGDTYNAGPADQDMGASAVQANVTAATTVGNAGGSQPVGIRSPYLGMTWCIAVQGLFPPRD